MTQEATIRRGARNARYAAIPNHVFEDDRLSMEARWLLGYLLSKPDNWTVVVGDIIKKGNCGRDKARKMIAELVDVGYAEREQQRADGKFGASVLVIFDEPRQAQSAESPRVDESVASLPQTDLPATAKPAPASPSPAKSAHSNNSYLANTDNQDLREGEREASEGSTEAGASGPAETTASIERAFWRLVKNWPDFDGMPKEPAKAPWMALTPDERRDALALLPDWLAALKRQRKSHVPAPSTYLRERLWKDLPSAPEQPAGPKVAAPYGKLWMCERLADLMRPHYGAVPGLTGFERSMVDSGRSDAATLMRDKIRKHGWTKVNAMHERAAEQHGYPCDTALLPACEGFRQVATDSELYAAWRREHERRGWPDLDATRPPKWVWLPDVGYGVEELDAAVQRALDDFQVRLSEVRGDEHAA